MLKWGWVSISIPPFIEQKTWVQPKLEHGSREISLFLRFFFDMNHFFEVFVEFLRVLFLGFFFFFFFLMFWFFGCKACEILAPWPGVKSTPHALDGKILTTGLPGRFLNIFKLNCRWKIKSTQALHKRQTWALALTKCLTLRKEVNLKHNISFSIK